MVSGPAAPDAIARARKLPNLRVGLHLVLVDGPALLPPERIADLVDGEGRLRADLARAGFDIFLRHRARRQLAAEIEAQFAAFHATGIPLDHVNAHHHFHVHPTVGRLILDIGRRYWMRGMRVPIEESAMLRRIDSAHRRDGARIICPWTAVLRRRVRRAGLCAPDRVFGIAWSGAMTERRIVGVLENLADGITEIYCHPAVDNRFAGAAPDYRYADELAALTASAVKDVLHASGARCGGFSDFAMQ